jgi:hypothetical protein
VSFLTPVPGTPGWFDDPTTPGVTRYWDGQRWTERSFGAPLPTGPRPAGPRSVAPYPPGFVPSTERPPRAGATTDSGAIWALVLAIIGCLWGIPSIVMAGKAKRRIRYSGGRLTGDGLATAAQIIGWIWVVLTVAGIIIAMAAGPSTDPGYPPPSTLP